MSALLLPKVLKVMLLFCTISFTLSSLFFFTLAVALKYYYRLKMGQPTNTTSLWVIGSKVYKTNITVRSVSWC